LQFADSMTRRCRILEPLHYLALLERKIGALIIAVQRDPSRGRARVWFDELASGRVRSLVAVCAQRRYRRALRRAPRAPAFVAPAIVEAICQRQQPADLTTQTLLNRIDLPLEWTQQEHALGIK
jgi:hypothetical protein